MLQIREPDLSTHDLAALVLEVVALARGSSSRLIVNDRLDIALACGAAGVHLRADSVPPAAVRAVAPPGFLIGRSVHGLDEAVAAEHHVDYLIAGTVWPSVSKTNGPPVLGLAGLERIVRAVRVPVLAIGGVDPGRMPAVAATGAAGVAAIGLFMDPAPSVSAPCRAIPLNHLVAVARATQ